MSNLRTEEIDNFWIRVYLNPKGNLLMACADRAYRDLNRTIHGLGKEQSKEKYSKIRKALMDISNVLIAGEYGNQDSFDKSHRSSCKKLIKAFNRQYLEAKLTVGQAQKWINMYLKYSFALGEKRIPGINKNYSFFHIPIDNIIQDLLKSERSIDKIPQPWSRVAKYDVYLNYQKQVRLVFRNEIPMDVEFKLFNERP